MKIILLSGGSGKRLWPLSNDVRSKQFLKVLQNDQGEPESMIQRVYRQIKQAGVDSDIVVATGIKQSESIHNQLGSSVDVVNEPSRRDTFPAIMLAASYLFYKKKINPTETVVVLPVDPYADINYFLILEEIAKRVEERDINMALMGIKPTYPSEKYGYLIPDKENEIVKRFQEKPSEQLAMELISQDALWNGGVFAFKLGYIMQILKTYISFSSFEEVVEQYESLPKISFDYEVVEKEKAIAYVKYEGTWKDLGTWNTLTEVMAQPKVGKVITDTSRSNTHILNELDIPLIVLGAQDMVVVASPDGILISDKHQSSYLKDYLSDISERPMCQEHRWGEYKVIDYTHYSDDVSSLTKSLFIRKGEFLDYKSHANRDEIITVVDGSGLLVLDGETHPINRGDVTLIQRGKKHAIRALTPMRLIEVQIGCTIVEEDAQEADWFWE